MTAIVYHRDAAGLARVGLVFTVAHDSARHGGPVNAEPHSFAKIEWFPVGLLPTNTYPYTAACVSAPTATGSRCG
jgi:8-oxo-dGTP diphosphatase